MSKKLLVRHLGNMGDMVFFVPPVLESLKKEYPDCHITFITSWGYKDTKGKWGKRNQGGHSLHLIIPNPHIDQLVHWHDTKLDLDGNICVEDGQSFPTWSKKYYEEQKQSGNYDQVLELDFGLKIDDNPIHAAYQVAGLPLDSTTNYQLYLTDKDQQVAKAVTEHLPKPRIALLEGLAGVTTRGWDADKIPALKQAITQKYSVEPAMFGSAHVPEYQGRPLTLRENIATLQYYDAGIGVLSGPLHFAAAVGLPTITLFCDQPLHRAAPAFFLNSHIANSAKHHRTLLGPSPNPMGLLKRETPSPNLTPQEQQAQQFKSWQSPGRQSTKSCLSVITVDEIMQVLSDIVPVD